MADLEALIEQDPWIRHGLTIATTNVVSLDMYRDMTSGEGAKIYSPTIPRYGLVLRATLLEIEVRKRQRAARAHARRLAKVDEQAARERAKRRRSKGGQANVG